ncbi:hypothetical protein FHS21_004668 [Phyllobacterium trifolii]|uniref:Uncharacterized protein n=1 Tax=Phyllobacterium trifolii TaxID=300193 RepID=A0A839UE46_9HYPH|nr:hypothetical protein [Phyllobacterium trifolii]MBB3148225.1 hypothetical protein [Phyllobacterium trifolii]
MTRRRGGRSLFPLSEAARLVEAARVRSKDLVAKTDPSQTLRRDNLDKIAHICATLVGAQPPIDPVAELVSEKGILLHGTKFPKRSTLLNDKEGYATLLRIWRGSFDEIMTLLSRNLSQQSSVQKKTLDQSDPSEVSEIEFYRTVIRRQKSEMDKLRHIISQNIPAPTLNLDITHHPAESEKRDVVDLQLLRDWVLQVERGEFGVEFVETGLQIGDQGRPRMIVMEYDVMELLRSL